MDEAVIAAGAVVKVPLDTRKRQSCTSNFWRVAFPHLSFIKKCKGTVGEMQEER